MNIGLGLDIQHCVGNNLAGIFISTNGSVTDNKCQ